MIREQIKIGTFSPQNRVTLKESVIAEIRRAIAEGKIKSGERLNESRIAVEMGLSKTPIREAVSELIKEGILESEPFKGTKVKTLSKKEVEELYSLREILELFAINLMPKMLNKFELKVFEKIVYDMEEAAKEDDVEQLVALDLKFHQCIVNRSGHSILVEVWSLIYSRLKLYMTQKDIFSGDLIEIALLHKHLLEKMRIGNKKELSDALRKHIVHYAKKAINIFP